MISILTSETNRIKVVNNLKALSNVDGTTNMNGVWKMKKKTFPKNPESLPFAKKDCQGKLVTSQKQLKQLYLDTFIHRLRHRPIKHDFTYLKSIKDELCQKRLKVAEMRKIPQWKPNQLNKVLSKLKDGKSCDPHGLVNKIFKPGVCGKDFEISLLMLMNKVYAICKYCGYIQRPR